MLRWFLRVINPTPSQMAGLVNKAPMKIQSLSLFIGSGGDRQHGHCFGVRRVVRNSYFLLHQKLSFTLDWVNRYKSNACFVEISMW